MRSFTEAGGSRAATLPAIAALVHRNTTLFSDLM
jgi:hypothetical protein